GLADGASAGAGRRGAPLGCDRAAEARRGDRLRRSATFHPLPGGGDAAFRACAALSGGQAPGGRRHGGVVARGAPRGAAVTGPARSAGLLLYRRTGEGLEVLLGHMGGPFFARRDAGAWTVPKGEYDADEPAWDAARRE